ncbi:HGxxPAAW family protein [Kitasatospora sp. NPDC002040]|uniref:HGxxPAAW family protein n=1 Tax=Kitasatospora sp. NPDC002040 TaxID=3154661 RepID=UPI00332CF658
MSSAAHGNTPAAWTGSSIAFIGFTISGVAMIIAWIWLFWVGLAVVVLGGVVGKAMAMAGMGKQPSPHYYTPEETAARQAVTAGV